jgi:dihydroxyacetone kinase DhaKLM complex PTS-EIIA-like component DhaM
MNDRVGLVIVSHSRALADALVGLLRQVASAYLPVAVAAGIGEDRSEFGTDAVEIMGPSSLYILRQVSWSSWIWAALF